MKKLNLILKLFDIGGIFIVLSEILPSFVCIRKKIKNTRRFESINQLHFQVINLEK